eukprot:s6434_g2.t2
MGLADKGGSEVLRQRLFTSSFGAPAGGSRHGNIFAKERSSAWSKEEPKPKPKPEPSRQTGAGYTNAAHSGDGSQAFRANLRAQGVAQRAEMPRPQPPTGPPKPRPPPAAPKPAMPTEVVSALRQLDLPLDAQEDQVKKAYRRLALLYHPDKNPSDESAEHFRRATKAYETCCEFLRGAGRKMPQAASAAGRKRLHDFWSACAGAEGAFAAILSDESVVTWGDARNGGDSRAVQDRLKNVQQIQASCGAFAAILGDGSVMLCRTGWRMCGRSKPHKAFCRVLLLPFLATDRS